VRRLNDAIASPEFLADLEHITGIRSILADEQLVGGGMHLTGSGGRLDVHVDFNLIEERQLHRRLNILLYLNPTWDDSWGGQIELWDKDVKRCHRSSVPILNRCLIFETSDISYHGVARVIGPPDVVRRSFAAYYYTREAPAHWTGRWHDTVFRARPKERIRGLLQMPAEKLKRRIVKGLRQSKGRIQSWLRS
jgi:Rps23 Pro-64 3,4-dihydroxylase Tpa1-like proline 4-hydroxylase